MAKDKAKRIDKYFQYHRRQLKNILRNLVTWEGLPETFDERAFNEQLLFQGFSVSFDYKGEETHGTGGLAGIDRYNHPTEFTLANPVMILPNPLKIGKDCLVCYNTTNAEFPETFIPLVDMYAWRLADIDVSYDVSIRNSRAAAVPMVNNEREAIRWGNVMQQIYDGEPAVLAYKIPMGATQATTFVPMSARDNLVVDLLADAKRSVMADFFSELGVKTIAVDKKERTNLYEMSSNSQQLKITSDIIMRPRQKWADDYNAMKGTNIVPKFNEEEVKANGYIMETDTESRSESDRD